MKKLLLWIAGAILLAIAAPTVANLIFAGGEDYNTDFPPPAASATAGELFPETIAGAPRRIERLSVDNNSAGYIARYGARTSITIVHSTDQAVIDAQAAQVVERTKMFDSRRSGKFNGAWEIKAYGQPGRIYAWQRQGWFYSVEAATDSMFLEMVEKLSFIAVR
ncbi:MAG: hypothetical protein M9895_06515 [Aquamicrobium sp.]|jgi:hypothetical protein|uniref:hypothetical protein n=1 Tax=Aquamicrobium sp. TaxID=1872579 RepID=UPI00349E6F83|nr:hypothetical protein [Aquamicrobium sp.]MCO5158240.1 hypothetical protein [Aquamicrobium sp.]